MRSLIYRGYVAHINYKEDQNIYFGKVIGVKEIVTFQGASIEELEQALRDAVEDYLERRFLEGGDPQEEYSGRVVMKMSEEQHIALAVVAAQNEMSIEEFIQSKLDTQDL